MVKNIIFDFDGIILESVDIKTEAFAELFSEHPDYLEYIIDHHKNNSGVSRYEKIGYYFKLIHETEIEMDTYQNYLKQFGKIISKKIYSASFVSGALEFLKNNINSYNMYIASATPQDELRQIVQKKNISKYFKGIYGSPQKKVELTEMIIDSKKIIKNETIFIGDAISDYDAATQNEIQFIGRISDKRINPFKTVQKANSFPIVDDLKDLEGTIRLIDQNES